MSQPNLTERATKILQESFEIAKSHGNSAVVPVHVLAAVAQGENGSPSFLQTITETAQYDFKELNRAIDKHLVRLPSQSPSPEPQLSGLTQNVLTEAQEIQKNQKDSFLAQDHIVLALFDDSSVAQILKSINLDKKKLKTAVQEIRGNRRIDSESADTSQKFEYLDKFADDLTEKARTGKIDPVIGREEEIRRCIRILARRTKSNPCLIGDPGVGKTSIVEGVAQRVVDNDVPNILSGCRIFSLDLGALKAGTTLHGQFEERVKGVLDDIQKSNDMIVLFIDEIHMLMGDGKGDVANLLKPMLARGEIHCIGATTAEEYRLHIEKDGAFERRFQKVDVPEPTVPQTIAILRGLQGKYEIHHGVRILDSAMVSAASLAHRYLHYRKMPDSAVDLIDEAAATVAVQRDSKPEELDSLEREMQLVDVEISALERDKAADSSVKERLEAAQKKRADLNEQLQPLRERFKEERKGFDEINAAKKKLDELENKAADADRRQDTAASADLRYFAIPELKEHITQLEEVNKNREASMLQDVVDAEKVSETCARLTGIPVAKLTQGENSKLINMERVLGKEVVGQPEAIKAVSDSLRLSRSGLANPDAPASFLFLGLSGSGKTELAKKLSGFLFHDEKAMIRIDCSELGDKWSASKLIGAAPGYIGFENGGILTNQLARQPYSVILFDEVEKAAPEVLTILLQVLDDGRVRASNGKEISAANSIIIMTSNLGAEAIQATDSSHIDDNTRELVMDSVRAHFRPEFLNRISAMVVFNRLSRDAIGGIVDIRLREIEKRFHSNNRHLKLQLTDGAKKWLAVHGYDKDLGARPLNRLIQSEILNRLAIQLLKGTIKDKETVRVTENVHHNGLEVHPNHEAPPDGDVEMDDFPSEEEELELD